MRSSDQAENQRQLHGRFTRLFANASFSVELLSGGEWMSHTDGKPVVKAGVQLAHMETGGLMHTRRYLADQQSGLDRSKQSRDLVWYSSPLLLAASPLVGLDSAHVLP